MTITLNTTNGNRKFSTITAACDWLEEFQPSSTSMTVDGVDVDYDFDAVDSFDSADLQEALEPLIAADDSLTAQELDGTWTVVDSSGQRFWPAEPATTADAALKAAEAGKGTWHQ